MRTAIQETEWSKDREDFYRRESYIFAEKLKIDLIVRKPDVFAESEGVEELLVTPMNPRQFWYETWLALSFDPTNRGADEMGKYV